VLWSLSRGLDEFPESPPPGLVTVPALKDGPAGYDAMAGYRATGDRAIRIDMLERLADMLRQENSRAGFEAKADMLSITGLSLEQFAQLMEGLGYRAEKGERAKVRPAPTSPEAVPAPDAAEAGTSEVIPAPEAPAADADSDALTGEAAPEIHHAPPEAAPAEPAAEERAPEVEPEAPAVTEAAETEVFYTFTWGGGNRARREQQGGRRGERPQGDRPKREGQGDRPRREGQAEGKPRGDRPWEGKADRGKGKGPKGKRPPREEGPRTFEARPERKDRIDPDNPFAAALMGFRTKD
jgi:ATP-dependent RNA helicase SUPV3L1/SUV3